MPNVILIADDDENDLKATRDTLKEAGARNPVKTVDDGDKVIAYFKGEGKFEDREKYPIPAILFLDLKMRRVDGFQVMDWIRNTRFKDILTVALSGHGDLESIRRAYALGARSFLTKPCEVVDVVNLMAAYPTCWETAALPKRSAGRGTNERRAPLSV